MSNPVWQERRSLIVGAGGVGNQIADKLAPFDANVVRVARTNRSDERGAVQSMDALPAASCA